MFWAVCAKSSDAPFRLKRPGPEGLARKKSSLAALAAEVFFSAKSCPGSGFHQIGSLNKKPGIGYRLNGLGGLNLKILIRWKQQ